MARFFERGDIGIPRGLTALGILLTAGNEFRFWTLSTCLPYGVSFAVLLTGAADLASARSAQTRSPSSDGAGAPACSAWVNMAAPLLVLTHPHEDHWGQAAKVLETMDVKRVVTSGESRGPPRDDKALAFYEAYKTALAAKGLKEEVTTLGESFEPVPGLRFDVLATGGRVKDTAEGSDINNDSLVLALTFAGRHILFAGDIEKEAGDWLVGKYCPGTEECPTLKSDILKVPNHGSAHFSPAFFEAWGDVGHHVGRVPCGEALSAENRGL